jgi:hypothetical protein
LHIVDANVQLIGLEPGKAREFKIEIRNDGTAPLKLERVDLDTGCEITRLPIAPVAPGKSDSIGLKCVPPAGSSLFTRTLTIHSNAAHGSGIVTLRGLTTAPETESLPPVPRRRAPRQILPVSGLRDTSGAPNFR